MGKNGRAYFYSGEIAGQTDFLYGFGTAWIRKARLALRGCGGGIAAWKGSVTSFPNKFGVYINEAKVEKANASLSLEGKCSLGRPWVSSLVSDHPPSTKSKQNDMHRSIFANCQLDDSIMSSGYSLWGGAEKRFTKSTFMAEYNNKGPGFSAGARSKTKLSKILTYKEFNEYNEPEKVFQYDDGRFGNVGWIDRKPEE